MWTSIGVLVDIVVRVFADDGREESNVKPRSVTEITLCCVLGPVRRANNEGDPSKSDREIQRNMQ
jgi:hypothetical protein